jgi:hypothetical protein
MLPDSLEALPNYRLAPLPHRHDISRRENVPRGIALHEHEVGRQARPDAAAVIEPESICGG